MDPDHGGPSRLGGGWRSEGDLGSAHQAGSSYDANRYMVWANTPDTTRLSSHGDGEEKRSIEATVPLILERQMGSQGKEGSSERLVGPLPIAVWAALMDTSRGRDKVLVSGRGRAAQLWAGSRAASS